MKILFVGDGERDAVTIPAVFESVLGVTLVDPETRTWRDARLNVRGFERKLGFAVRQAMDARMDGVVATVDRDKAGQRERLKELQAGRQRDRDHAIHFPTGLGEANPHGESWLLGDDLAVRQGFRLPKDTVIPAPASVSSLKTELQKQFQVCPRVAENFLLVIQEIARKISLPRCRNAKETGFADFVEDIESEFRKFRKAS